MNSLLDLLDQDRPEEAGQERWYAQVIMPLALPKVYTYVVPLHLKGQLQAGMRVEVPFGRNKRYAGLIHSLHQTPPPYEPKPILELLDAQAIVTTAQLKLWEWMAEYYVCTLGEVMQAALPSGLKLSSETILALNPERELAEWEILQMPGKAYAVLETLRQVPEMSLDDLQKITKQKILGSTIQQLMEQKLVFLKEEMKERYRPRYAPMLRLVPALLEQPEKLKKAFDELGSRASRQLEALLAIVQLSKQKKAITRKEVYEKAKVDGTVLKKLADKGLIELYEEEISRLLAYEGEGSGNYALSEGQRQALAEILAHYQDKAVVLLHGVTGSGKTQVFVELMQQYIAQGKQVLYLLPEIALTAQIVGRLQKHFGDQVVVYHSKFNSNERVEVWQQALKGRPIVLGARSALFLPFQNLGLIIVDEEHDPSYKQVDPAPRYNARDAAAVLTQLYPGAKVLLGSATPSLESYYNVQQKKYGLVEMQERFGGIELPEVFIADAQEETRNKNMKSHFTPQLLNALEETIQKGEQAILFQNRRGYAPMYRCGTCAWTVNCVQCDVSLTYHKYSNELQCHYCGHQQKLPRVCGACGSTNLLIQGFGTEKIEDELKIYLPDLRISRMDWDTVKGKHGHDHLIQQFGDKEVDVLVGTQMVTKGLDFDNVGLVGVLSADQMLHFPDFRATERAFQLMTQVSGRAGRKKKRGRVIVQAFQVQHPVLREVKQYDFMGFLARELQERNEFQYPPFTRLIKIQLKHTKVETVQQAAQTFAERLKLRLGEQVLGPAAPGVPRVRGYFLMDIMLKLPRGNQGLKEAKAWIVEVQEYVKIQKGFSALKISVDVDPY